MTSGQQPPDNQPQRIDLSALSESFKLSLTTAETDAERDSRIEKEKWAARHANWQWWAEKTIKEYSIYVFALVVISVVGLQALGTISNEKAQAPDKQQAQAIVTNVLTGVIAYLFGKSGATTPSSKS